MQDLEKFIDFEDMKGNQVIKSEKYFMSLANLKPDNLIGYIS